MVGLRAAILGAGLLLLVGCTQTPAANPSPAPPAASSPAVSAPSATAAPTRAATAPVASQATAVPRPEATVAAPEPIAPAFRPGGGTPVSRPLFLEVAAPAEDTTEVAASTRSVVVAGRASPGAVVSVNEALAAVDEAGMFQIEVALTDEVTLIEVVASDSGGREVRTDRIVVRD